MRKTIKRWGITAIGVIAIAVVALSLYDEEEKPTAEPSIPPTVVDAATATATQWNLRIPATGVLAASQGVMLRSSVVQGGIVTGIFFRSGQYVQAGQPLLQINPGDNRTVITAPFSGRVGLKYVNLGSYVSTGSELVTIQDSTPIKVDFSIPQSYLPNVAIGDTALVNVNSYPNQTFQGQVYAINAALDPTTRTIEMWASIPNEDAKLLPGMFVNVTLIVQQQVPVVVAPQAAVSYTDAGNYVFVISKGIAHKTYVTIGMTVNGQVGITKGLNNGDVVATSDVEELDDGWPVIIKGTPQYQQYEAQQAKANGTSNT